MLATDQSLALALETPVGLVGRFAAIGVLTATADIVVRQVAAAIVIEVATGAIA
jgi:hypothetical protein